MSGTRKNVRNDGGGARRQRGEVGDVPVRILQGGEDLDVPWRHALALCEALTSTDVIFTLIKDGDHRLSRPQDLKRLIAAVEEL